MGMERVVDWAVARVKRVLRMRVEAIFAVLYCSSFTKIQWWGDVEYPALSARIRCIGRGLS